MMKNQSTLTLISLFFLFSIYSSANTFRVPLDFPNIQEAIDIASDGDTILVAPGTYQGSGNRNIRFLGKNIVLTSEAGPEQTIIDCEGATRGFGFFDGEQAGAVLNGFTIINSFGGGNVGLAPIVITSSSPTIRNCIIENNPNVGIRMEDTEALITNCIIRNNSSSGLSVSFNCENAIVQNCLIIDNTTTGSGGGVFCAGGSPLLLNCTIADNQASNGGGIIMLSPTLFTLTMRNCILWGNTASSTYPSVFALFTDISYSCIEEGWVGPGNIDSNPIFADALYHLPNNSPAIDAGNPNDDFTLEPAPNGGRINMGAYGNTSEATTGVDNQPIIFAIDPDSSAPQGGMALSISGQNFGNSTGQVLLGGSPAMINSWSTTTINCSSPAHSSGRVEVEVITANGDSDLLTYGFTYTGPVVYQVPQDWPTIQKAIDAASDGDTVLVAPGTYTGLGNRDIRFFGKAIVLTSETGPEQTIIDCGGVGRGFGFFDEEQQTTILNGFTITNSFGGGNVGRAPIVITNSSPSISNCIIENNPNVGVRMEDSEVLITNCIFRNNSSSGISVSFNCKDAVVQNCLITNNVTTGSGGGVFCAGDSPLLLNCTIADNQANNGGGIIMLSPTLYTLTMRNCILWGNTASSTYPSIFALFTDISYSCIEEGWVGLGNIDANPLFADGLYHLRSNSPAVDAGNPNDDFALEPAPNGGRINMGAYGNTPEATTGIDNQPIIFAVSPDSSGPQGGVAFSISGQNFGSSTGQVLLGGSPATIASWSTANINCISPAHPSGRVDVEVITANNDSDLLTYGFTYTGTVVHRVPQDWPTIQKAIDAASDGDTILVAPGTYTGRGNRDIRFFAKTIVLTSEAGPEQTIINCEEETRGFGFIDGEQRNTILNGFTITNSFGGGNIGRAPIVIESSSPTISNCIIEDNPNVGIRMEDSEVLISNCIFQDNSSSGISVGFNCENAVIQNCLIINNITTGVGGGVFCAGDSPLLLNCTIAYNQANEGGGVIMLSPALYTLTMRNCILWGNEAITAPSILAENYSITYSNIEGGWPGTGNIDKNPIFIAPFENDFHLFPASPCVDAGDPNDDFSMEPSPNGGRVNIGAYGNTEEAVSFEALVKIVDFLIAPSCESTTEITISGVNFGNTEGSIQLGGQLIGVIDNWTDTLVSFEAASNQIEGNEVVLTTFNGPSDTIPQQLVYSPFAAYVSGEVSGIWTADCPGTYILTGDVTVPEGQSLTIQAGVRVLVDRRETGSSTKFLVEGTLLAEGDSANPVRFSALPAQRAKGVWQGIELNMATENENAHLNHCLIEFAKNGILAADENVLIENCIIHSNKRDGVRWEGNQKDASGVIKNCEIRDNEGWGISCYAFTDGRSGITSPLIEQNLITQNIGGGIYIEGQAFSGSTGDPLSASATASPIILNNRIKANNGYAIEGYAKGIWTDGISYDAFYTGNVNPHIENNLVYNNANGFKTITAPDGAFWLASSRPTLVNSTFWDNGSVEILAADSTEISITNCIFWGGNLSEVIEEGGGKTIISNSNFEALQSGTNNISADPLFFNPTNEDFRLRANSPCIDTGDNNAVVANEDFFGNIRITDGNNDNDTIVDIGAIEYALPQIIAQSSNETICEGESIVLFVRAIGENLLFQWQKEGQDILNASADTLPFVPADPVSSGQYSCIVTDELGGSVSTNDIFLTVDPLKEVSISITPSSASICDGEMVLLNATPINGGNNPMYQWILNGQPVGNNDPSISLENLIDGDEIYCLLTSSENCTLLNPVNSDSISIEVFPLPIVRFNSGDTVDVNQPPFELMGGTPIGGTYSGPGVSNNQFDPALAGIGQHIITYSYTDANNCTAADTSIITVRMTVGNQDVNNQQQLALFPNPTSGKIMLQTKGISGIWTLAIYSNLGQVVLEEAIDFQLSQEKIIDLRKFPNGFYLLKLVKDDQILTRSVVVQ